jgi:ketosteroid isomerase-like protein
MSGENIEIVRRAFRCWNEDDWGCLAECYDPDVVVIAPPGWPEASDSHGWKETRVQFERLKDSWAMERIEVDEVRDLGDDRLFVRFRWIVSGRASGAPAETPASLLVTVGDARITRAQFFFDQGEALEAAGLSE